MFSKLSMTHDINQIEYQKMLFIFNAINDGWIVKKINNKFVFIKTKFDENYASKKEFLTDFINTNLDSKKLR